MPAPPPPPPMAPAAPPPPIFKQPKGKPIERDALLKSIRSGAKLKKTITNDKSAPMIQGTMKSNSLKSINNNDNLTPNMVSPMKNKSCIQMELKKQLANDPRNRRPPPPAPNRSISSDMNVPRLPFSLKENISNGLNFSLPSPNPRLQLNPSSLHRKVKSNANLSTLEIVEDVNGYQPNKPVISHGKPNLAPKPPVSNDKPIGIQKKNTKTISRTHSLKTPRSPSPQNPENNINKFGTVRHMSSIISQSLAQSSLHNSRSRPALNGRPSAPPPSVPPQSNPVLLVSPSPPPPPPPKVSTVKHPNHAPPPPPPMALPQAPSHAPPPPPPHKTNLNKQPPVPVVNNINPPPPPPRHSSMREAAPVNKATISFDEKFKHMFETPDKFPSPPPYRNVFKVYTRPAPITKSGFVV